MEKSSKQKKYFDEIFNYLNELKVLLKFKVKELFKQLLLPHINSDNLITKINK